VLLEVISYMKDVVSRETMVEEIKSQLKAALETDYFVILRKKIPLRMLLWSIPFKENGLANIFILLKKREKN